MARVVKTSVKICRYFPVICSNDYKNFVSVTFGLSHISGMILEVLTSVPFPLVYIRKCNICKQGAWWSSCRLLCPDQTHQCTHFDSSQLLCLCG